MFNKTGRDTASAKVQRYPDGLQIIDGGRIEQEGLYLFDDFFGLAMNSVNQYTTGEEGSGNSVDPIDAINGVLQISTGTGNNHRNCIASRLSFSAERGVIAEFRIKTKTSDSDLLLFCGLTDYKDETSGKLPCKEVVLVPATYDGWAADHVGFAVNTEQSDDIFCVSGIADSFQSKDSGVDLVIDTWMILRIELDTDGNAKFYINNTFITAFEDAVTTDDPLCLYLGGLITDNSTAALIYMDYWAAWQTRIA